MRVDVIPVPIAGFGKELNERTAVVIDVLRATTTIITALTNGCQGIIPVLDADEAGEMARRLGTDCLLGGERHGLRIEGFQLGNSPLEYTANAVGGRRLVFTTTNGTRAIRGVASARLVVIAGFANLQAVAAHLKQTGRDVVIVCSGSDGSFSLEDATCAGALVHALEPEDLGDAAVMARILYRHAARRLASFVGGSEHGQYLKSIGLGEDVRFCTRQDWTAMVPVYQEGRIAGLPQAQ